MMASGSVLMVNVCERSKYLMTWEEYRNMTLWEPERWKQIPVECPKCGKNIYVRIDEMCICYTLNTPGSMHKCECGWQYEANIRLPDSFFEKAFDELIGTMKGAGDE
jgi:hypothetical protein